MHGQVSVVSRQTYRPDIDGLRAVAVLSVMAYHYGAPLPGGFTGVDVFFVISGFLITSNLMDDIRAGAFSVLGFYDRRMRRILPALLAMLAVAMLAGNFLLIPGDYIALAKSTAAAAFGFSNFFFVSNTGYFDQSADLMPLLHTWSLAVEEQFYLAWPLLLFAIAAGRKHLDVAAALATIVVVGFATSLFWFDIDPKAAFFMALPRAWELAIGALLVFLPPLPRTLASAATALGLALIIAGFLLISAASFPGPAALCPCIGSALVIWPRREQTVAARWLGYLSPVGLISYSLYLWHWPMWVMFRIYNNNGTPRIREAVALAAASIILAVLSYHFVEQPFRKRRLAAGQTVWAGLFSCMLIFCCAMYVVSADGLPERLAKDTYAMRSLSVMWEWPCPQQPGPFGTNCGVGDPNASLSGLAFGDSQMETFLPVLDAAARKAGINFGYKSFCLAFWNPDDYPRPLDANYKICPTLRQEALDLIRSRPDALVIIAALWSIGVVDIGGSAEQLDRGVERLLADIGGHRRVVLIAEAPFPLFDPIPCVLNAGSNRAADCAGRTLLIPRASFERDQGKGQEVLRRVASRHPNVKVVFPAESLCDATACRMWLNGEFLYRDPDHIRRNLKPETVRQLAQGFGIAETLRGIVRETP